MKKPVNLNPKPNEYSDDFLVKGQRTAPTSSEPEVEERLMTLHH